MTIEVAGTIITVAVTIGGVLIYVGRSLQTLKTIDGNQKVLFDRTEKHADLISEIDKRLATVETRQDDCSKCP